MMDYVASIDWASIFAVRMSVLEIILRGSLMYLGLFIFLRVILKRQTGSLSTNDLLVIVLIADAAQNGMAGEYKSVPEGLLLVATLIFWDFALDWLAYHVPFIDRLIAPPPLPLIMHGKIRRINLRRELITVKELHALLREQGVDDVREVKHACLENDGRLSVVTGKKRKTAQKRQTS